METACVVDSATGHAPAPAPAAAPDSALFSICLPACLSGCLAARAGCAGCCARVKVNFKWFIARLSRAEGQERGARRGNWYSQCKFYNYKLLTFLSIVVWIYCDDTRAPPATPAASSPWACSWWLGSLDVPVLITFILIFLFEPQLALCWQKNCFLLLASRSPILIKSVLFASYIHKFSN